MQDKMVIYDNEKQTIGWTPANCDHPPRSDTLSIWLQEQAVNNLLISHKII